MVNGDRVVLALYQRLITLRNGHKFRFGFKCTVDKKCEAESETQWEIDLRRILLTEEEIAGTVEGSKRIQLPGQGGAKIDAVVVERLGPEPSILGDDFCLFPTHDSGSYRLFPLWKCKRSSKTWMGSMSSGNSLPAADVIEPYQADPEEEEVAFSLEVINRRVVSVEGKSPEEKTEYIHAWDWGSAVELQNEIGDLECGIETEYEVACSHKKHKQWLSIPLMNAAFFSPESPKRSSGRR